MADDIERWITVGGRHIPIRKGESVKDAVNKMNEKGKKEPTVSNIEKWARSQVSGKPSDQALSNSAYAEDVASYVKQGYKIKAALDATERGVKQYFKDDKEVLEDFYRFKKAFTSNFKTAAETVADYKTSKGKKSKDGYVTAWGSKVKVGSKEWADLTNGL